MFNRIQKINNVVGDNNIIVNGDVVVSEEALYRIATQLLRADLERYTKEAREQLQSSIKECTQEVLGKLVSCKLEEKVSCFSEPSTQFAYYEILKGYAIADTLEQREILVDAFIERLQANGDSTEKMIIDSALDILPRLTVRTLSTLALLQLRHQIANSKVSFTLNQYFASLTPLVEEMAAIDVLDIEYLKQERLILPLAGLQTSVSLEKYLLKQYDLFFRHPLGEGVYEEYCRQNPVAREIVSDTPIPTILMWIDSTNNNQTSFCCANSGILKQTLQDRGQEYIIPHVDTLMKMMPPFTEDEVQEYFKKLTPDWKRLFTLFSSDVFTQYVLSITGNYIGGKILAKASHGKPLALEDYKHKTIL